MASRSWSVATAPIGWEHRASAREHRSFRFQHHMRRPDRARSAALVAEILKLRQERHNGMTRLLHCAQHLRLLIRRAGSKENPIRRTRRRVTNAAPAARAPSAGTAGDVACPLDAARVNSDAADSWDKYFARRRR
ncbi:hypothetical protein N9L68_06645 [bacterium]|nr:hypothetical protein [bacterium]